MPTFEMACKRSLCFQSIASKLVYSAAPRSRCYLLQMPTSQICSPSGTVPEIVTSKPTGCGALSARNSKTPCRQSFDGWLQPQSHEARPCAPNVAPQGALRRQDRLFLTMLRAPCQGRAGLCGQQPKLAGLVLGLRHAALPCVIEHKRRGRDIPCRLPGNSWPRCGSACPPSVTHEQPSQHFADLRMIRSNMLRAQHAFYCMMSRARLRRLS